MDENRVEKWGYITGLVFAIPILIGILVLVLVVLARVIIWASGGAL